MGVSWNDHNKIAHVLLVLPDGRIVCQRPTAAGSMRKNHVTKRKRMWQATAYRKISRYATNTEDLAIKEANYILKTIFSISPDRKYYHHLFSHYVQDINRRLEIVLCQLPSRKRMEIRDFIEVRFVTFEKLVEKIKDNETNFTPQTIHVINIIGETWRS